MKQLLNKVIAITLSMLMFFNVAAASSLNDILLKNTTYAGSWEDPSTGMNYYSGGGIKIKFKGASNAYTPWIKGSVPSVSVGCNGISISGGFISLLGLSDIEDQLQDAGAAFAWGILIGLAYSLPAISNVFQQIQKWARAIQSLLQNACSIGQNLARNSKAAKATSEFFEDNAITEGFDKIKKFMDDQSEKLKVVEDLANCTTDECFENKDSIVGKWLANIFSISPIDTSKNGKGSTSLAAKNVIDLGSSEVIYKEVNLSDLLSTSSKYTKLTESDILNIKLSLLFFGDIALSEQSRSFISKHFESDGTLNKDAFSGTSKKLVTEGLKLKEAKYELLAPVYTDTEKIVDILLNGTNETLYVPDYKIGILQAKDKDSAQKTSYLYLFKDSTKSTSSNLALNWGGFFNEGVKQVVTMLNTNADGSTNYMFVEPTVTASVNTGKDYVPVLIPNLKEYISRMKRTALTKPGLKFSIYEMANKIAQVNAAMATYALINEVAARVKKASLNSTEQKEVFLSYLKDIEKTKDSLIAGVKKVYKDDRGILQNLLDDVNSIENEAKKDIMK